MAAIASTGPSAHTHTCFRAAGRLYLRIAGHLQQVLMHPLVALELMGPQAGTEVAALFWAVRPAALRPSLQLLCCGHILAWTATGELLQWGSGLVTVVLRSELGHVLHAQPGVRRLHLLFPALQGHALAGHTAKQVGRCDVFDRAQRAACRCSCR
jgi:hypothetical protein